MLRWLELRLQLHKIAALKSKPPKKLWRQGWLYFYRRFIHRQGKPEYLARGLAAGVFTGWFPFFGLQIIFGVGLATLLRGHKILAAVGTWVSNPVTSLPIYWFNFYLGQQLLGFPQVSLQEDSLTSFDHLLSLGADFLLALFFGSFVMGMIGAIASYFTSLWLIRRWYERQMARRYQQIKRITGVRIQEPGVRRRLFNN